MNCYVEPCHLETGLTNMKIISVLTFAISVGLTANIALASEKHLGKTLVMDFEITGDSSVTGDKEDNIAKINTFSSDLREKLQDDTRFDVINDDKALAEIGALQSEQKIQNCNGCELSIAEQYNANWVMTPYVFRMSHLISTLHIEIKDAETGQLVKKKAFDFRGNTNKAWQRAVQYAVRDLKDWQP